MYLEELGRYKEDVLKFILKDRDIIDALNLKHLEFEEDIYDEVIYKNVFPYLFAKSTGSDMRNETKCYICVETIAHKTEKKKIKTMRLIVRVFSNIKLLPYKRKGFYGNRVDILCDMLDRKLEGSRDFDFSIGEMTLTTTSIYQPSNDYYGRELVFDVTSFYA